MLFSDIWGADSGDIVAAVFAQGTIHPPGYPIYYLLGLLFKGLPWGTPAQRVALVSLLFAFLTLVNLKRILEWLLVTYFSKKERSNLGILKWPALALFASGHLFLIYSAVPEVFSAALFFQTLNLLFLLRLSHEPTHSNHLWFLGTFLLGLTFQYTIVFNLVVYLFLPFLNWRERWQFYRQEARQIFVFLLFALLPYLLLYFFWQKDSIIFWEAKSWVGLLRLLVRSEYGLLSSSSGAYQNIFDKLHNVGFYLQTVLENFSFVGLGLAIGGGFALFRTSKKLFIILLLLWFLYGPFLFFYFDIQTGQNFSYAVLERFGLYSFPFLALFIFFGSVSLTKNLSKQLTRVLTSAQLRSFLTIALLFLLLGLFPLLLAFKNGLFVATLSKNQIFTHHAENLLGNLPRGSIVMLSKDLYLFPAQYYRYVLERRPDLILIAQSRLPKAGYARVLASNFPSLILPSDQEPNRFSSFLFNNLKKRRIFTNQPFASKSLRLDQYGLLYEIRLKQTPPSLVLPNLNTLFLAEKESIRPVYFYQALAEIYREYFYQLGVRQKEAKQLAKATNSLSQGYKIDSQNHDLNVLYALLLFKTKHCKQARSVLERDYSNSPTSETAFILSRLGAVCFRDRQFYHFWNEKAESLPKK